jgi:hypothetical protein
MSMRFQTQSLPAGDIISADTLHDCVLVRVAVSAIGQMGDCYSRRPAWTPRWC